MPTTPDGRPYRRVVVELHPDTAQRLRYYVDSEGKVSAQVIRRALQEYLQLQGCGGAPEGWK